VRDLGIELGQGYFLGYPEGVPARSISPQAAAVVASSKIAVLPALTRVARADFTVERLSSPVPAIEQTALVDDVGKLFAQDEALRSLAIVSDGRPVGLLNQQSFLSRYAKPYFKELYGRKSCMLFANTSPLLLDKHTGLEALTGVLTSPDQRYPTEGFIVTEGGRFHGLGTGEQLVRVVTEVRIEAARHANPLTFLPGNIPISEHISRLIASGGEFVACYGDLNDFKRFNDHCGYWRGDEMIRRVARSIVAQSDARRDFVGHVGGDDFVVLFQSEDWMDRRERIISTLNEKALSLFDDDAMARGGIDTDDRHGVRRFFKFTTLSIGAVRIRAGQYSRPELVASAAAAAKHKAKMSALGLIVESA
jgi:diguanylate cyclase (GGDEF)-like protein